MKIGIESIKEQLEPLGWKVISTEYKNLDTEMEFQCDEGHSVHSTWKKLRNRIECPICKQNIYKIEDKPIPKKNGIRVLALDQATHNTGWAIFDDKQLVQCGVAKTKGMEEIDRLKEIRDWFVSMINQWKPDYIGIEGIQYQANQNSSVTTFQVLARLQGVLMITAKDFEMPLKICPTNTWRAHCGVKGRARTDKKNSMKKLIKDWFDMNVSDDIADAIGIGKYMSETIAPMIQVENWE